MSVRMKRRHISQAVDVIFSGARPRKYRMPIEQADGLQVVLKEYEVRKDDLVSAEELFKHLDSKYTKAGAILRGARLKSELTQSRLAEKLKIPQGHISAMEHGKRPIGKNMAKRLGLILNIDYRVFLF